MDKWALIESRSTEFVGEFSSATLGNDIANDALLGLIPRFWIAAKRGKTQIHIEACKERKRRALVQGANQLYRVSNGRLWMTQFLKTDERDGLRHGFAFSHCAARFDGRCGHQADAAKLRCRP